MSIDVNKVLDPLGLFQKTKTPDVPAPIQPPSREDASSAADIARREATARGRAQTVLTNELGVGGNTNKRRTLGVA